MRGTDLHVVFDGSIVLFEPETHKGERWLKRRAITESWQWLGKALAVDPRYASDLIEGAQAEGLEVQL